MSKNKINEHITRIEAAERLAILSKQLRDGTVSLGDGTRITVAGDVDLKTELKDDKIELEVKWHKAKDVHPQPVALS